jgi:hypothetical protein
MAGDIWFYETEGNAAKLSVVTFAHPSASYLFFGHQPLVLPGPLTVVVSHGRLDIRIVLLTILFVYNTVAKL